ncbi:hypothetical protein GQ53DRAFT_815216 [Thozetella sp. PMI_491]|nr:hypothetical protein GQ53DRAFT_815216 [Thozetella sp. PMI_491]
MAEIFALAGGVVGVAAAVGQLVEGIAKLHEFCSDIQDIPEDIQIELKNLNILCKILHTVQADLGPGVLVESRASKTGQTAILALRHLEQSSEHVHAVLQEMDRRVGTSKRWIRIIEAGRLKTKLREAVVRVRDAQGLLNIALVADSRYGVLRNARS